MLEDVLPNAGIPKGVVEVYMAAGSGVCVWQKAERFDITCLFVRFQWVCYDVFDADAEKILWLLGARDAMQMERRLRWIFDAGH
jgi:hypothetical protein